MGQTQKLVDNSSSGHKMWCAYDGVGILPVEAFAKLCSAIGKDTLGHTGGQIGRTKVLQLDLDGPGARRVFAGVTVAGLHVLMVLVLITQSATVQGMLPSMLHLKLIPVLPSSQPPLRPLVLPLPPSVSLPDIVVALPPPASAPRAVAHAEPAPPPALHFGAASGDAGLGLDVAAQAGGGAASRGSLADFEAAVKQKVLAGKRQPGLAWDRRNTCVVNYTVHVSRAGTITGFTIAPCAIPEINQAARDAIQAAAPFPAPPDLGAATYAVHGTLIFRP